MDDNILKFSGVTLVNDTCPMFTKKPSEKESQREPISLGSLLTHFSKFEEIEKFSLVGFSSTLHSNILNRTNAYACAHVQQAVLINVHKTKGIRYNKMAWANEDIEFNREVNKNGGHIVKCLRYVTHKKKINYGGGIPCDVPDEVLHQMKGHPEWAGVEVRKTPQRRVQETGLEEGAVAVSTGFVDNIVSQFEGDQQAEILNTINDSSFTSGISQLDGASPKCKM